MKYQETNKQGQKITRWKTDKKYSKEELEKQRNEFIKEAESGNTICLTDLMINHGM